MSGPSLFRVPGKLPITFRAARSRSTGLSRMWRAGPSVIFSTASEKSGGPLCGPCGPRGGPLRSRVVAEEAEFAYKDFAAVVDMLTASTSPVESARSRRSGTSRRKWNGQG